MSTPEERWWSVRAGEYVLGTLRGEDLELFERILAHDTEMQLEVARWERQLGPLNETARARSAGEHVWPRILERVRAAEREAANANATASSGGGTPASATDRSRADAVTAASTTVPIGTASTRPAVRGAATYDADPAPADTAIRNRDRADGPPTSERTHAWPALTGFAAAASLALGLFVGALLQRQTPPVAAPLDVDGLAVVLSDADGEPYFLVETDYGNLRVRVTALTPPSLEEERNFQLWQALPDRSGVRPVALLPTESGRSQVFDVGALIEGSDLFGVSIEPDGAPTDGGPTGPVVAHGDFLPRTDDAR